ncbi:hypothetical protein THAOC_28770 [Thalassiosira oceanica]|uniref:Uncharacterized protein n=1 Tax=Thalassiosira oceanica TaxID=159749 RepID=K0RI92_THAOC|nr:hypothetical protein THAOC_28770 [Thalassiosira oceanica]|eukprot:EJK52004.1 hypothetical protein THAOC_28770 [Thalassiosira oceanica]
MRAVIISGRKGACGAMMRQPAQASTLFRALGPYPQKGWALGTLTRRRAGPWGPLPAGGLGDPEAAPCCASAQISETLKRVAGSARGARKRAEEIAPTSTLSRSRFDYTL